MSILVILSSSAHCICFVCCNFLLSDIISQIGPIYPIGHVHDIYVYVLYIYKNFTIINIYLLLSALYFDDLLQIHTAFLLL